MINKEISKFIIKETASAKEALMCIEDISTTGAVLFVIDGDGKLQGTLTDGDIRRGLLKGFSIESQLVKYMRTDFKSILENGHTYKEVRIFKDQGIKFIPVVSSEGKITGVIDTASFSFLPVDAVVMAGGEGRRLKPLTDTIPKPMLRVGDKPIIEHNIDRLVNAGITNITITVKYLSEYIKSYFKDGKSKGVSITYIDEDIPMGTIGSLRQIDSFDKDYVLVMNSDLLTNIDFEDFYNDFLDSDADMAVATVPYKVDIPYAVLETDRNLIYSFKEKPSYTYYSNAGIYLVKKSSINIIPRNTFYNATDLMEYLIKQNKKVLSYPLLGYWLDIGRHEDFQKAQEDIKHIKF